MAGSRLDRSADDLPGSICDCASLAGVGSPRAANGRDGVRIMGFSTTRDDTRHPTRTCAPGSRWRSATAGRSSRRPTAIAPSPTTGAATTRSSASAIPRRTMSRSSGAPCRVTLLSPFPWPACRPLSPPSGKTADRCPLLPRPGYRYPRRPRQRIPVAASQLVRSGRRCETLPACEEVPMAQA
jgi:hypothetical protein